LSESKIVKKLSEVAEGLRRLRRGMQGLPLDEDVFSGLLNVKDIRERTRLNAHEVYAHSYMRMLASFGGEEWSIMGKVADMDDTYLISLEGEQRKEAILMQRAKAVIEMPGASPAAMSIPKVETKPTDQGKEEKKGLLRH